MRENTKARMRGLQPTLPLVDAPVAAEEDDRSDIDAEWHLDDHTREVGRLGIAAARACLRRSSTDTRRNGTGRGATPDTGRRAPGRAA
jgi:hypothetical protein